MNDYLFGEMTLHVDDYDNMSFESVCAAAKKQGQVVKLPGSTELFLDIDSAEQFKRFTTVLNTVEFNEDAVPTWTLSPSKKGYPHVHIIVDMKRGLEPLERIALQAILGSDPVRETISLARLRSGNPSPTVFFENP